MNKYIFLGLLFAIIIHSSCAVPAKNPDKIYQYSTIQELLDAKLSGSLTFRKLKLNGDHGIGTFNNLDGEMIMLDGIAYRANYEGILEVVDKNTTTPFAVVDHFIPDSSFEINGPLSCEELKDRILGKLEHSENIYSIEIPGNFSVVNARSVRKPDKEGAGLEYVVQNDNKFDLNDLKGTAVGFWFPESFAKANVPGFHFHFVSEDKKRGGHILDCMIENGTVRIDSNNQIEITLIN